MSPLSGPHQYPRVHWAANHMADTTAGREQVPQSSGQQKPFCTEEIIHSHTKTNTWFYGGDIYMYVFTYV